MLVKLPLPCQLHESTLHCFSKKGCRTEAWLIRKNNCRKTIEKGGITKGARHYIFSPLQINIRCQTTIQVRARFLHLVNSKYVQETRENQTASFLQHPHLFHQLFGMAFLACHLSALSQASLALSELGMLTDSHYPVLPA